MKLWVDDIRSAPKGYTECKSVKDAKMFCYAHCSADKELCIDEINLDHDAGDYAIFDGDYINILNFLENKQNTEGWKINCLFKFHSANPVGVKNMIRICIKNDWKFDYT